MNSHPDAAPRSPRLPRWCFHAGCFFAMLFGVGHFFGFLSGMLAKDLDPDTARLFETMRTSLLPVPGRPAPMLDVYRYFSGVFSVLLWVFAASAWCAVRVASNPAQARRAFALLGLVLFATLMAFAIYFGVAPGIGGAAAPLVCFVWVLLTERRPPQLAS